MLTHLQHTIEIWLDVLGVWSGCAMVGLAPAAGASVALPVLLSALSGSPLLVWDLFTLLSGWSHASLWPLQFIYLSSVYTSCTWCTIGSIIYFKVALLSAGILCIIDMQISVGYLFPTGFDGPQFLSLFYPSMTWCQIYIIVWKGTEPQAQHALSLTNIENHCYTRRCLPSWDSNSFYDILRKGNHY